MALFGDRTGGWRFDLDLDNGAVEALTRRATRFGLRAGDHFETPTSIDPRSIVRIEDQGPMGSCQGHSLTSCLEMLFWVATGQRTEFSRLWAYYLTQMKDGLFGRDQGSTISGGIEVAAQTGICLETMCPYPRPVAYDARWRPTQAQRDNAAQFRIRSWSRLRTYDDVFNYLATGQGFVHTGSAWMWQAGQDGITRLKPPSGGHSVPILGFSDKTDSRGRHYLTWPQSWGPDEPVQGWQDIAPHDFEITAQHSMTVLFGVSDLSTPAPRHVDWSKLNVL